MTITTISTALTTEVAPGQGNYALGITITNTGSVVTATAPAVYATTAVSNASVVNNGLISNTSKTVAGPFINNGTLDNAGTTSAVQFTNAGTVVNGGTITALGDSYGIASGSAVNMQGGGVLQNNAVIDGGVYGGAALNITNAGNIENNAINGDGLIMFSGGSLDNSGYIEGGQFGVEGIDQPLTITDSGTIFGSEAVYAQGSLNLIIDPGASFGGAVFEFLVGGAEMTLAGATRGFLDMGTSFTDFGEINFETGASWMLDGTSIDLAAGQTIAGFAAADTLVLESFTANTLDTTYVTGTGLELTDTAGNHITLDIAGNFSTSSFIVTANAEETSIDLAVCYLRGTKILTPAGEVPVESLNIGDAVITKFGGYRPIKWIGRQSFARPFIQNNFEQIPVRITAGALGHALPRRDLWISPGHSMLINNVLVLAKSLVNGITITQGYCPAQTDYFQLEFETHDCVLAEGAWSESYADTPGLRGQFHNVADFYARYPNHTEPAMQTLCAARPLDGTALEKALGPIAALAATGRKPGALQGYIDEIRQPGQLRGWARDDSNPELPVLLEILVRGRVIGTILACDHRPDLQAAGHGSGRSAFTFTSPIGLPSSPRDVQVRRAADGAWLPRSTTALCEAGENKPRPCRAA
jgi:hypothetical protein